MTFNQEKQMLIDIGCEDIEYTSLVNNYYFSFTYKDRRYTIEHILNVYGAEVDFWEISTPSQTFGTLEELLNYIK